MSDRSPYKEISAQDAKQMIDSGVKVIDVRTPPEYQGGHIPQARLIPLDGILARGGAALGDAVKEDQLIFVCQVGQRSAVASTMAAAAGVKQVYNLAGGTDAWIAAGLPVER